MTNLNTQQLSNGALPEGVPAIAALIAVAVATFDADRNTSRRYLLRASAILQACTAHEPDNRHGAQLKGGLAQWQLNRVIDYIEQHVTENITGEDLAALIDVSIGQLFRAFKVSVGMPPHQYIASRKLEYGCLLMRNTREPLSQIALTAGFCDQSHLCRVFRRELGVTPTAWRRKNATGPDPDFANRPKGIAPVAAGDAGVSNALLAAAVPRATDIPVRSVCR